MISYRRHIIPFLLLLPAILAMKVAFTWTETTKADYDVAMEKTKVFYNTTKHYSVLITHSSYRGWESDVAYEEMHGYYKRDNNDYHSFLLGAHTIQNEKYRVIVDSASKSIVVSDPQPMEMDEIAQLNYDNSLLNVTSYKTANAPKGKMYRLEFNEKPSFCAYTIDLAENGQLREMIVFYRQAYSIDPSDPSSAKAKPKLKITYNSFDTKASFDVVKEFDTRKYFTDTDGILKLTKAFANYHLVDARISKKNKP